MKVAFSRCGGCYGGFVGREYRHSGADEYDCSTEDYVIDRGSRIGNRDGDFRKKAM